jgi:hypothetical protein
VYPDYENDVVLLAVGFQSGQTVDALDAHFKSNSYPGFVAEASSSMARDYQVTVQSTKFGVAPNGEILLRSGYGSAPPDTWRQRLQSLVSS